MCFNDHTPAHFQAEYGEYEAVIEIDTLSILRGELPRRALALVLEWATLHREGLRADWERARGGEPLDSIAPLDSGHMRLVRIKEAKPLAGHRVLLTLTDGRVIERDLGPLLTPAGFGAIRRDSALFKQMRVEGGTLVWPNRADLYPDVLIWGGLPSADAASDGA